MEGPHQQKNMSNILKPRTYIQTLFGKRTFAGVIKDVKMKSSWIILVSPKANGKRPYNEKKGRHGSRREGHVGLMEAGSR